MSQRLENISTQMEIILSAIYMATSHISDEQSIKQSLRSAALTVMAETIELVGDESIETRIGNNNENNLKSSIKVNIYKAMSFIKVLRSERMMTDKNADLLIMTYKKLLSFINDFQYSDFYTVTDNIKDIDYNIYTGMSDNSDFSNAGLYLSKNTNKVNININNKKVNQIENHNINNNTKLNRRTLILDIIKRATHASQNATQGTANTSSDATQSKVEGCNMSDILAGIRLIDNAELKGISEKTVQRELNSMIADGLIMKKGEKRWSRYILPSVLL